MKLSFSVAGQGEPLLMIHGIISDGSFFAKAVDILKDNYKVITYDRRGYGASKTSEMTDYSVMGQARDAIELLVDNVSEPAWIVGNSAGGLIAIEMYLQHPELVKGLILLEPSLVYDEESVSLIAEWNKELNGYVNENKIKKALAAFSRVTGQPSGTAGGSNSLMELKQTYANLANFMHGELNDIQSYRPEIEKVKAIKVPVRVLVTEDGSDSIFARTSVSGAKILGWKTEMVPGYHNTIKDNANELAIIINEIIMEMRREV